MLLLSYSVTNFPIGLPCLGEAYTIFGFPVALCPR